MGAGPGEAGLITRRGAALLANAQVILFDALVDPAVLDLASPEAERIDVGRRARRHPVTQDRINRIMREHAERGRRVVRLKGGDPFLFGRGAEEAEYLAQHGIACQVVPGLTAGIAAPLAAGIPVTRRGIASTVTFATGHEDPERSTGVDYPALAALARAGGTLCFYMGIRQLPAICRRLIDLGVAGATPAAVVQWATLPRQRTVRATLAALDRAVKDAGLWAPSIIVVGKVASIAASGLDAASARPLFGQTVVVTRAATQAAGLSDRLTDLGARVLEAPTLRLTDPDDWSPLDDALRRIDEFDWLVLTSANAADAVARRLEVLERDARHLARVRVAVVGRSTAAAVWQHLRLRPDMVPRRFVAESLVESLIGAGAVEGRRFLLPRADIAREVLPRLLADAGAARVADVTAYCNRPAATLPVTFRDELRRGNVDWITFTSGSTARHLVELLGEDVPRLGAVRLASIGAVTSATLRELGLEVAAEADPSDIAGLVEAIVEAIAKDRSE